jgi:hypothetical protein
MRHDTVAVELAGNLIGSTPSTNAEKIVDKSVLWKPCGAGGDKRASLDHNRLIHGGNSGAI